MNYIVTRRLNKKYLVTRYETYNRRIEYEVDAEDEDAAADMDYDSDKLLSDTGYEFYDEFADVKLIREEVIIEEPEDKTNTPLW